VKRLREQPDPSFHALTQLVQSVERHVPGPFAKRATRARIERTLEAARGPARFLRPALVGAGVLLMAVTAAAAGYSLVRSSPPPGPAIAPPSTVVVPPPSLPSPASLPVLERADPSPSPSASPPSPSAKRALEKPSAGEDPTLVAEAVRALRKQGDAGRAQSLLDQYLRKNPRGALVEDALALSIEAAAARKDPRAADYARRYVARYPNGRFRALADRALSR
jgi:hypothetical protein